MKFEWHDQKNISNFKKHNLWFEEAQTIWTDPTASEFFDPEHNDNEDRYIRIGWSTSSRLLLVVFCEREGKSSELSQHAKRLQKKGYNMEKEYNLKKLVKRPGKVKVDASAAKLQVNIRLDGSVLAALRTEAERLGIPYQTLIGSVLHRFATGQLVDRKPA